MPFIASRPDGLTISDDAERLDIARICAWLGTSYWAADRDRATIERSIANSHPYAVYGSDGKQIAIARAVTDLASFAWIGDVIVDESRRGEGIGTWLVAAIVEHLTDLGVPRFVLATRDAHQIYERIGFEPLRVPSTWMEIDRRPGRLEPS